MKVGDLVICRRWGRGLIVGFNEKGLGGKDFVHVLLDNGEVMVIMSFDLEVISNGSS